MKEVYTKLDKEYLKAFNLGYEISKETGLKAKTLDKLKPEQLETMSIDKNQLSVIKFGMKQYEKDLGQNLNKEVNKMKKNITNAPSKERGFGR